ncbi:hypothetical protein ACUXG3_005128 [Bacillus thuringiensis]
MDKSSDSVLDNTKESNETSENKGELPKEEANPANNDKESNETSKNKGELPKKEANSTNNDKETKVKSYMHTPYKLQQLSHLEGYWITKFVLGTAVDKKNQYTQFPKTYQNYLQNNPISWNEKSLGGKKGDILTGTLRLPRQFIYTYGSTGFGRSDNIIMGAQYSNVPIKNELKISFSGYDKDEFEITFSERTDFFIKEPQINNTSMYEGELCDFQEYQITIKRLKNAGNKIIDVNFNLDIEWITNPYFFYKAWYTKLWYNGHSHLASQLQKFQADLYEEPPTLTAEPNPQYTVLGKNIEDRNPIDFVQSVKLNGEAISLSSCKYYFASLPNTNTIGNKKTKIHIETIASPEVYTEIEVPVTVKWGHTVGSNNVIYNNLTGFSLSLLTNKDKPRLVSTLGNNETRTSSWINDYKNGTYITINLFDVSSNINLNESTPHFEKTVHGWDGIEFSSNDWNTQINDKSIKYGDVLRYDADPTWGDNKWIYRGEKQEFESEGKREVYYELTKSGYQILHINQLTSKKVDIKNGATTEEVYRKLQESVDLKGYENIKIERFKVKLPNTQKDGEQKVDVVVSETLQSGKKVGYTYTVPFVVNPVVTEKIYNSDGKLLETKQTELQYGKDYFSPNPKNRLEVDGIKYNYEGWLSAEQKPGKDVPKEGKPNTVKETTIIQYIYSDLNKMIHVTIPTEMFFSSSDTIKKNVQSNIYKIENHANKTKLNINLASFETKENAGIQLLTQSDPDPIQGTEAMRLHLLVNGIEKINSLNETSKMLELGTMNPKETWTMQFGGKYFGELSKQKKNTDHSMVLKFAVEERS